MGEHTINVGLQRHVDGSWPRERESASAANVARAEAGRVNSDCSTTKRLNGSNSVAERAENKMPSMEP